MNLIVKRIVIFAILFQTGIVFAQWNLVGNNLENFGWHIQLAMSNSNTPYAAISSGIGIKVFELEGGVWTEIGDFPGINTGTVALEFNSLGDLFVSYIFIDFPEHRFKIKKYDGTNWTSLPDSPDFLGPDTRNLEMVIDSTDNIYMGYAIGSNVRVKMFDGTNWQDLGGNIGVIQSFIDAISMAVDNNDRVFIFYNNANDTQDSGVKIWDGIDWEFYGPSFEFPSQPGTALTINPENEPVIARENLGNISWEIYEFDGQDWIQLGEPIPNTTAGAIDLCYNNSGTLFFANYDTVQQKTIVSRYFGGSWDPIGEPFGGHNLSSGIDLEIDSLGVLYVSNVLDANTGAVYKNDEFLNVNSVNLENFIVYPIPANNEIQIQSESQITGIKVFDEIGREVLVKYDGENITSLNLSKLNQGIYFIQLTSVYGSQKIKKILKE